MHKFFLCVYVSVASDDNLELDMMISSREYKYQFVRK